MLNDISNLERFQRLTTRLETGIRQLPYEESAAAGPSFLSAATTDYRLQNIYGLFGY